MSAPRVRADYDQLAQIARAFGTAGNQTNATMLGLKSAKGTLQSGDWVGRGATAFYDEMDSQVLPALQRLVSALQQAQQVTVQISVIMQQVENEVAALFRGSNGGQSSEKDQSKSAGSASGQVGPDSSGDFHIGPPTRPNITHDNGFTGFCANNPSHADCASTPGVGDYANRAKYEAMLRGAQVLGHLDDGTQAYEHYLYGHGEDLNFAYNEFVNEDKNGRIAYNNIMVEAQRNAEIIGQGRDNFSVTSNAFAIGTGDPRFPYPDTENWAKAIGAHQVWTSANVQAATNDAGQRVYTMEITYHAEDRYNFNPGMADIATGAKDRENGRFEVLGWAHPFMSYGETTTTVTWTAGSIPGSQYVESAPARRDDRQADRRGEIGDR